MKKWISLVFVALLVFSLSACSGDKEDTKSGDSKSDTKTAEKKIKKTEVNEVNFLEVTKSQKSNSIDPSQQWWEFTFKNVGDFYIQRAYFVFICFDAQGNFVHTNDDYATNGDYAMVGSWGDLNPGYGLEPGAENINESAHSFPRASAEIARIEVVFIRVEDGDGNVWDLKNPSEKINKIAGRELKIDEYSWPLNQE